MVTICSCIKVPFESLSLSIVDFFGYLVYGSEHTYPNFLKGVHVSIVLRASITGKSFPIVIVASSVPLFLIGVFFTNKAIQEEMGGSIRISCSRIHCVGCGVWTIPSIETFDNNL